MKRMSERVCTKCRRMELTFEEMVAHWSKAHGIDMIQSNHTADYFIDYVKMRQ